MRQFKAIGIVLSVAAITLCLCSMWRDGAEAKEAAAKPAAKAPAEPADNSFCYACHANYNGEKLTKQHQPVGVGCEKCHGLSVQHSGDEDNITPPDRMFSKADVDPFCITCHDKPALMKREDHRLYLKGETVEQTCNECHAKDHHMKVRTRQWDKKTHKLIKDDGVRMMGKK
jgi:hypothetical protein